eukprot:3069074-Karenia_brevis.AAC.1
MLAGDPSWGLLSEFRARLLLGSFSEGTDVPQELKHRLRLWERGHFAELTDRVTAAAQCIQEERRTKNAVGKDGELSKGSAARRTACHGTLRKAMQKFVGTAAPGTAVEQAMWAPLFLPQAEAAHTPHPDDAEWTRALSSAWGG